MYPFKGSDSKRKSYVLYMNECLRVECAKYGYLFIDIYDAYCDSDGYMNMKMSDGSTHIQQPRYLAEFIQRNFGQNK